MQDLIMLAIQKIPKRTTNLNQIWPLPYLFSLTNMEPANNLGLATSGESASSGLHESDNDSDPETRGAPGFLPVRTVPVLGLVLHALLGLEPSYINGSVFKNA